MPKFIIAFLYYLYNSFITNIPCYFIRTFYLKNILRIKIGKKTYIHMGCFFTGNNIKIGNNTVINRNCFLDGRVGIEIGNNVSLSQDTYIISLDHDPQSETFETISAKVIIKDYVWTGMRCIILPGVTLGIGCIAGAGAVVTKSFEDFSIVAGNPARKIGTRNKNLKYNLSYNPYFNTDILP
jgi:maltose O-acetyltransferase